MTTALPSSMQQLIEKVADSLPQFPRLPKMFADTFSNTFTTTLQPQKDGSVFVITGDIPAMWLRDSAAQVKPYLHLAKTDGRFADLIANVVKRQVKCVLLDPYANAFNETANGRCHNKDKTEMSPWVWERKYELDSVCAPLELAHALYKTTGQTNHLDQSFQQAARVIIETVTTEQRHANSPYSFERFEGPPSDTLTNNGRGNLVTYTGMSWSGFRPSDDACKYNYLVPSNMLAVVALKHLSELPLNAPDIKTKALALAQTIRTGIEAHGKVKHPFFGDIYAYETDGVGNYNLMDDANVPSLLSAPYLGYCTKDDPVYKATRAFVLSKENPYYHEGKAAKGIGSPHTPDEYIWPIALCMQGLTSDSRTEQLELLGTLLNTDASTGLMHESFHKDDPGQFTRPWFAWANSLFAEFVLEVSEVASRRM
jgi:uncharacterized protein